MKELDRLNSPGEIHEGDYFRITDISQRLRKLRTEKGLAQHELAQKIDVSPQLIRNYEAAGENNGDEKIQKSVAGMKIETLYKLGKFYGVSADYILCRTDVQEGSTKIRDIRKYLGLEESAINALHDNSGGNGMGFLNRLLSTKSFINLLFDVETTALFANVDELPDVINHFRAMTSERIQGQALVENAIIQASIEFTSILKELAREIIKEKKSTESKGAK